MIHERLNRLLEDRNISNAKLAAKAGISAAAIGKILNGADLKLSSLKAIANALNVPMSFFVEEEKSNNIVVGQQSIAGAGNTLSVNSAGNPEGITTDQEAQDYKNALQIIAAQKEEILSLQSKVILLQDQLLQTHK
ncbi:MAG: helix-turn-helix domain-containing protein [Tannerellaceae bacterium]|nr:helix-turn-helix domain-containing protein [Tannerellaceae bacterium]